MKTKNDFIRRDIKHLQEIIRELEARNQTKDITNRLKTLKKQLSKKQLKHKAAWED